VYVTSLFTTSCHTRPVLSSENRGVLVLVAV
jgi:hypothetical protein